MAKKKSKTDTPILGVLNALLDAALLLDSTGVVLSANPAFEKLLGIKSKDISGKQVFKAGFLSKESQQLLKKRLKKLEAGSSVKPLLPQQIEVSIPDGSTISAELSANTIDYEDTKADLIILHDISQGIEAGDLPESSSEYFKVLMEYSADIIVVMGADASISYVSPSFERVSGYKAGEVIGKNAFDYVHSEDIDIAKEALDHGIENPGQTALNIRLLHSDGSWRYCELMGRNLLDNPTVNGIVLNLHDITQRKQAEQVLRDTEGRFKSIFENANDAIVYFDMSGTVVNINPKVTEILGYTTDDVIGKNFTELGIVPYEDMKSIMAMWNQATEGTIVQQHELAIRKKDGAVVQAGISSGIVGPDNEPEGLFVILRDITKRKQAEIRIEHLNAILRAIRNVNQLIIREGDKSKLIQKACDTLTSTHGYDTAWIVMPNDYGEIVASADSGIGTLFPDLTSEINNGRWPQCAQLAFVQPEIIRTNDPNIYCQKCPVLKVCGERGALTTHLQHQGNSYGVFCVSGINEAITGQEELDLFQEVASDIAFALYSIEIAKHKEEAENQIKLQNQEIQLQFVELEKSNAELRQAQKKLLNANQMLRESEEKHRNLIENAGTPIIYFGRNGRILTINAIAAANLHGEPSDFVGKSVFDLFPDVSDALMQRLRNVIESEASHEYEDFFELPAGKAWFQTGMHPVKDADGKVFAVQAISRDITKQKQTQQALHETESKLRVVFDTIKDGITISDLDGNIIDSNKTGLERHGLKGVDELAGKKGFDFIVERDREQAIKDMEQALANEDGTTNLVEYTLRTLNGREIPVEASATLLRNAEGKPIAFINVTRDITERKKAEAAIRESEQRFRALLDKSSDGIAIINADGTFGYRGPVNDRILGYEEEGESLTSIFDVIHPDDQARLTTQFAELLEKQGAILTEKYRARHKDGSWRTLEVVGRNLVSDPSVNGIVVNFRDVTERQEAEETIRASEQKFRDIFDNVSDEIIYIDNAGIIVDVNKRVTDIFGWQPEEIIGKNFSDYAFASDEEMKLAAETFARVIETGKAHLLQIKGQRKDGSTIYVEVSPSVIKENDTITGLLIVVRDITKRKEAENLFTTLATNSQIGTYIVQDGVFKFVNPAFVKDLELTEKELLGKSALSIVHPDDRERVRREAIKMLKGESSAGYEFKAIDKYGNTRHAFEKVTSIMYEGNRATMGSYMDITERKLAEEALHANEEKWRLLAENAPVMITHVDLEGKIVSINYVPPGIQMTLDEIVGKNVMDFTAPEYRDQVRQVYNRVIQTGVTESQEIRGAYTGEWYYSTVGSIKQEGKVTGLTVINTGITELKEAQEQVNLYQTQLEKNLGELQIAYEKLKELDKLKDDFLSTVSHELRTPLTSIKSFTEILLTYDDDRETQKEFLTIINDESDRLTRLVNDFLDLSKIESGRMQWESSLIDISQIIPAAVTTIETLANDANLRIIVESDSNLPLVWGDKDRFTQVINNLLSNAIKFSPKGGSITVQARLVKADTFTNESEMIKVSIKDTGKGLTAEEQKLIFEKFSQVKDSLGSKPKGTGLGLPICKQIVEHYGGTIRVESEIDKGSTFTFTIPVPKDEGIREVKSESPQPEEVQRTGDTILIVDDEVNIRRFMSHELSKRGYRILEATSGKEAVEMAKQHVPDLITMDVILPDVSGFQVASELKNEPTTQNIPILIVSIIEDKDKAFQVGVKGYITKPFKSDTILGKIQQLLRNPKGTILVVDDDEALVESVVHELKYKGFTTSVAYDGEEALKIIRSNPPDLIILDLMMPVMNGQEVIRELKRDPQTACIPIIVLTGIEVDEEQVRTISLETTDYLTKSVGLNKVLESAANILSSRSKGQSTN